MTTSERPRTALSRRAFVRAGGIALGALWLPRGGASADRRAFELSDEAKAALASSPYVYVSPLLANGEESRCHGEVWYFFDRGDAVLATGHETWKARALARGRDRARIWVGDYGRVSLANRSFREAPTFAARAARDTDDAAFERLLAAFGRKYPDEWGKWEPRFRKGWEDGTRVMIRYTPVGA